MKQSLTRVRKPALEQMKAAGAVQARIRQGAAAKSEATGRDIPLKLEPGKAGG